MLREIIVRKLPSRCILIQDSVEQSGHTLWEAFIQHAVDEDREIHIYCFETPVAEVQRNIIKSDNAKVHYYDVFYDHRNWLQCCGRSSGCAKRLMVGPKCLQYADGTEVSESDNRVVFVDSLSLLIFSTGLCDTYAQLHALCNTGQVVCVIHEDVLPAGQGSLDTLNHLATTCLRVTPPSDASEGNPLVEIRHLKPGGGILRQTEIFRVGADKEVISEKMSGLGSHGTNHRCSNSSQLPQDLTTFKLDLEQNEKQARSKLVLPYIRTSVDSAAQSGEGKVFYQPDAADDWDEEDPDDDLDV